MTVFDVSRDLMPAICGVSARVAVTAANRLRAQLAQQAMLRTVSDGEKVLYISRDRPGGEAVLAMARIALGWTAGRLAATITDHSDPDRQQVADLIAGWRGKLTFHDDLDDLEDRIEAVKPDLVVMADPTSSHAEFAKLDAAARSAGTRLVAPDAPGVAWMSMPDICLQATDAGGTVRLRVVKHRYAPARDVPLRAVKRSGALLAV